MEMNHSKTYSIIGQIAVAVLVLCCGTIVSIHPVYGVTHANEQYLDTIGCSTTGKRILLSDLPNNTLTLKISRWTDYHTASSFLNFHCKFNVIAPRGHGLMAIVQGLNLRKKSGITNTCRDYIAMEQNDGMETGSICGEADIHDTSDTPIGLLGPRYFYDAKGNIEVTFSIDESPGEDSRKPIFLQLVFTSYSECSSTSLLTQRVRQCAVTRPFSCIPSKLFCDGIINCGYRGSDFGADEKNCSMLNLPVRKFDDNIDGSGGGDHMQSDNSLTSNKNYHTLMHGKTSLMPPIISISTSTSATSADNGGIESTFGSGNQLGTSRSGVDGSTSTVHSNGTNNRNNEVPLPITIALISAISGALVVLVVLFFCCCLGRRLDRLHQHRNNEELGFRTNRYHQNSVATSPPQGFELSVTQSSGNAAIVVRNPDRHGSIRKPSRDDLPPPYDAIFPKTTAVVPEKH